MRKRNSKSYLVIASIAAAVLIFGILIGYSLNSSKSRVSATNPQLEANAAQPASTTDAETGGTILSEIFGTDSSNTPAFHALGAIEITFRLFLSVVLAAVLAFRPRKNVPLFRRNLYVAQTQILLAVVAAALMMIVGDNAARAFAIFAAVSLVRFRTNIRDPKEITVLLISLALGLAAGVGRWDLGIVLCLFALGLLQLLEYKEPESVYRAMELTVKTRNTDATQETLDTIFRRFKLDAEVREFNPPDEKNSVGSIMYYTNLRLNLSTDYLSEQILAADSDSIESIQWKQKKNASYVYQ